MYRSSLTDDKVEELADLGLEAKAFGGGHSRMQ